MVNQPQPDWWWPEAKTWWPGDDRVSGPLVSSAPLDERDAEQKAVRLTTDAAQETPAVEAAQAARLNRPTDVRFLSGSYDAFPAEVIKVSYGDTPPLPHGAPTTQFAVLKRIQVLRDATNNYPQSLGAFLAGQDDTWSFLAQPLLGVDCPDYYVKAGDIVMAFRNRSLTGWHYFTRDEDPFIGQVTAVGTGEVTVDRNVWAGDPDGGGYAGPTFTTKVKNVAGATVSYAHVRPVSHIVSQPITLLVDDWVWVARRGRHCVAWPLVSTPAWGKVKADRATGANLVTVNPCDAAGGNVQTGVDISVTLYTPGRSIEVPSPNDVVMDDVLAYWPTGATTGIAVNVFAGLPAGGNVLNLMTWTPAAGGSPGYWSATLAGPWLLPGLYYEVTTGKIGVYIDDVGHDGGLGFAGNLLTIFLGAFAGPLTLSGGLNCRKIAAVADLGGGATLGDVIAKINELLAAMRTANYLTP